MVRPLVSTSSESAPLPSPPAPEAPATAPAAAPAPAPQDAKARLFEWLPPVVVGVFGLFFGHHPMMLTGLGRTQRDWGDTRFVNYLLEHGYRWLLRRPHHQSFWDAPFFYPAKGVLAYAESMFGAGPYYWIWRLVGFPQDTAFQLWMLTLSALNFATVHLLLRRCLRLSPLGSALGAFFFAFANMRVNQVMHHQLFPHFYSVICVYALFRIFEPVTDASPKQPLPRALLLGLTYGTAQEKRRVRWIAAFFVSASLQLYASFYLGWFLVFCTLLVTVVVLALRGPRQQLFDTLVRFAGAIALIGGVVAAVTAPMVLRYMGASREVGMRPFEEVLSMLPPLHAWFDLGPENWLYRGWQRYFANIPMEHEQRLGLGVLTTGLFLVGLVLARKRPGVRLLALGGLGLFLLVTFWAPNFIPWRAVYAVVPGAGAVRAISRIGLQLLLPVSIGLGALWDFFVSKKLWWLALPLFAFATLEQLNDGFSFSKELDRRDVAAIVKEIRPGCEAFFYTAVGGQGYMWKYQNDAMIASLVADVPTLNGYSGNFPAGWALGNINIPNALDDGMVRPAYDQWIRERGLDPSKVCWVKVPTNDDENAAEVVSVEAPSQVMAGQPFQATVVYKNSGSRVWSSKTVHRLGSQAPRDNTHWGLNRVELPHDIALGETLTLHLQLRAPAQPGVYPFQWRMVQDTATWFGQFTPFKQIEVVAAPVPLAPLR